MNDTDQSLVQTTFPYTHTHWILAFPYTHSLDPVFARFLHPQSSGHASTLEFGVESSHTILKPRGIMRFASATFK